MGAATFAGAVDAIGALFLLLSVAAVADCVLNIESENSDVGGCIIVDEAPDCSAIDMNYVPPSAVTLHPPCRTIICTPLWRNKIIIPRGVFTHEP